MPHCRDALVDDLRDAFDRMPTRSKAHYLGYITNCEAVPSGHGAARV
jgi:hypothetical protein